MSTNARHDSRAIGMRFNLTGPVAAAAGAATAATGMSEIFSRVFHKAQNDLLFVRM